MRSAFHSGSHQTRHRRAVATESGNSEGVDIVLHRVLCPRGNVHRGDQVSAVRGPSPSLTDVESRARVGRPNPTRLDLTQGPEVASVVGRVRSSWRSLCAQGTDSGGQRPGASDLEIKSALAIWTSATGLENNRMNSGTLKRS